MTAIDISDKFVPYFEKELKFAIKNLTLTCNTDYKDFKVSNQRKVPDFLKRLQQSYKAKYECPVCPQRKWTTGLGQIVLLYTTKQLGNEKYAVQFKVLCYSHRCVRCNKHGNNKAYEDEMERVATGFAEKVCTKLGY